MADGQRQREAWLVVKGSEPQPEVIGFVFPMQADSDSDGPQAASVACTDCGAKRHNLHAGSTCDLTDGEIGAWDRIRCDDCGRLVLAVGPYDETGGIQPRGFEDHWAAWVKRRHERRQAARNADNEEELRTTARKRRARPARQPRTGAARRRRKQ